MDICETRCLEKTNVSRHPWELARAEVIQNLMSPLIASTASPTILDLGCGDVFVAQRLCSAFPQAAFHCVDVAFTPTLISTIAGRIKRLPISLYASMEQAVGRVSQPVDAVLLLDVIEHVEQDVAFLKELRSSRLVMPRTKIILTVPAFQSLFSNHDLYLQHFRRYDRSRLANHLHQAGFEVQQTGYFFLSLFLLRAVQKRTQRRGKIENEKGVGLYRTRGKLDQLFARSLYADFLFGKFFRSMGIHFPGLSCFAIASMAGVDDPAPP